MERPGVTIDAPISARMSRRLLASLVVTAVLAGTMSMAGTAVAGPSTYQDYDSTGTPFSIVLPQGDGSFADVSDGYNRNGDDGAGEATALIDPTQAVGAVNEPAPTGVPTRSVSLGDGGSVVLRFQNNVLRGNGVTGDVDAGSDIYVFETGSNTELVDVQVHAGSPTATCPTSAGSYTTVGRTTKDYGGVDIDDDGFGVGARIFCVRLVDVQSDLNNTSAGYHGAEIDALGARSTYLQGDLSVTKTATPASVNTGANVTYTITGRNLGPSAVSNATVTDALPASVALMSANASQGSCTGTSTVTCNFGTVNGGASATATIVVRPTATAAGTTLSNTATIAHGAADPDPSNDTSDADPVSAGNQPTTTTVNNRTPSASNDSYTVNEDATLDLAAAGVLANDSDPDGNPLSVGTPRPVTGPSNGTLNLRADGSFTYTPNANFNGSDTFTYRACDDRPTPACSSTATVTVTVGPTNDDPVAVDDLASADEDGPAVMIDVVANDTDGPDQGESLTVDSVTQPPAGEGSVEVVAGSGGQPDRVRFTPSADFFGQTTFTYTIADGNGGTDTATVTVTVGPTNDDPVAVDDSENMDEDDDPIQVDFAALVSDAETADQHLSYDIDIAPADAGNGTLSGSGSTRTFAPTPDFNGVVTILYTVTDRGAPDDCGAPDPDACAEPKTSAQRQVTVTVEPVNDALTARDDVASTGEASAVRNAFISQYASSGASAPSRIYRFDTDEDPYTLERIGSVIIGPVNALGYRSTDHSLYGYRKTKRPGIVRIDPATARARFLGVPRGLPTPSRGYITGDVSPNGETYYLYESGSGVLRKVNMARFRTTSVTLSSRRLTLFDFAVSPTDGNLYGVRTDGSLVKIEPRTGRVTTTAVAELAPGSYGATWFTSDGDLIAYENGTPQTNGTLTWIERPTSAPSVVGTQAGPYTKGNDGAAYVAPPDPSGLTVVVHVLANDGDPDDSLNPGSVRILRTPAHGSAVANPDGTVTYTTDGTYEGSDSFSYEVCDAGSPTLCATATVDITAAPAGP